MRLLARKHLGAELSARVDASDVVQDSLRQAAEDLEKFRGHSQAEWVGWLREILAMQLAQVVRRYFKTQRRDIRLERRLSVELDKSSRFLDKGLVAAQSTPSRQALRREQAVLLADALKQLPVDYREVIILSHLEGLSFAEVAKRMGRTLPSVDKLWVRALARLRRVLGVIS